MLKKLILTLLALSLILPIPGCSKQETGNGFFAWMDTYMAVGVNSENVISTTLFFKNKPFAKENVINISFLDLDSSDIIISSYTVNDFKMPNNKYKSYSITLNFTAQNKGIYKTNGLKITLDSSKSIDYIIGDWTFDVDIEEEEVVDTWSSTMASGNNKEFPYNYTLESPDLKMVELLLGEDYSIQNFFGLETEGRLPINDYYNAPIVYIKTKIRLESADKEIINYGKGCYCGALGSSEDLIDISKEQNGSN